MKTDYSNITSRLFQSYSKSKSKSKSPYAEIGPKTIKKSIQKIHQISDQHYNRAMKHVDKFNNYQTTIKVKKQKQKQAPLDSEYTFKPTLYKSKYPNLIAHRKIKELIKTQMMVSTSTLNQKKKLQLNIGLINDFQNKAKYNATTTMNKTANRLITWAKNKDSKIVNKTIQIQVQKSLSRESYKSNHTLSKKKSYATLHKNKQTQNSFLSGLQNNPVNKITTSRTTNITKQFGSLTPKNDSLQKLTIQTDQNCYYSAVQTPKNNSFYKNQKSSINNKMKISTSRNNLTNIQSMRNSVTLAIGSQLLQKQSSRGQNSYYLRQAKANIKKSNEGELMVQDKRYSNRYKK